MILTESFTGNLVSASVSEERTFQYDVVIRGVEIVASTGITETITIIHKTSDGTEFIKEVKVLSSETDFAYHPLGDIYVKRGDYVKVTITNANTTGTVIGLITVQAVQG